jgi:uncharacterized metal-binding protein
MNALECDKCSGAFCAQEKVDRNILPDFCPMKTMENIIQKAVEKYARDDVKLTYVPATITEREAYEVVRGKIIPVRPRIRELVEFSKKVMAKKIGVAFCTGLSDEASRVADVLRHFHFTVYSVRCKCGAIDKTRLGVPDKYKIGGPKKFEAACNPITQALLLNSVKTDLNVIVGLCIGHDMLFTKYSEAPVTTLIVKDRYTGHNPLITLYSRYHKESFLK